MIHSEMFRFLHEIRFILYAPCSTLHFYINCKETSVIVFGKFIDDKNTLLLFSTTYLYHHMKILLFILNTNHYLELKV